MKNQTNTQNVRLLGVANYQTQPYYFSFEPYAAESGAVPAFCCKGIALQHSNGSFEFTPERRSRITTKKIKKLPHGRLTINRDGYVRLTLTLEPDELLKDDCAEVMAKEACKAANALTDYLRK